MSEEESGEEGGEKVYLVSELTWRASEAKAYFAELDVRHNASRASCSPRFATRRAGNRSARLPFPGTPGEALTYGYNGPYAG
jgi:hypothetical protein